MHFTSSHLGPVEFEEQQVIEFPAGVPAFENCRRFKLFHQADSTHPQIYWLQSLDRPELLFNLTDPAHLGVRYAFDLSANEADQLQLSQPEDALVMVMVYKDDEAAAPGPAALAALRANLCNPLLINVSRRRALQKTGLSCDIVFGNP